MNHNFIPLFREGLLTEGLRRGVGGGADSSGLGATHTPPITRSAPSSCAEIFDLALELPVEPLAQVPLPSRQALPGPDDQANPGARRR